MYTRLITRRRLRLWLILSFLDSGPVLPKQLNSAVELTDSAVHITVGRGEHDADSVSQLDRAVIVATNYARRTMANL